MRLSLAWCLLAASVLHDAPVDFNRDVRPILSDACFHCHGPDKAKRKADLRLDTEDGTDRGDCPSSCPASRSRANSFRRITSADTDERDAAAGLRPQAHAGPDRGAEALDRAGGASGQSTGPRRPAPARRCRP